eukprot:4690116-Alexandrium_andersonii.AAC.1
MATWASAGNCDPPPTPHRPTGVQMVAAKWAGEGNCRILVQNCGISNPSLLLRLSWRYFLSDSGSSSYLTYQTYWPFAFV